MLTRKIRSVTNTLPNKERLVKEICKSFVSKRDQLLYGIKKCRNLMYKIKQTAHLRNMSSPSRLATSFTTSVYKAKCLKDN